MTRIRSRANQKVEISRQDFAEIATSPGRVRGKGYMQRWLEAARQYLRANPHLKGDPSHGCLQAVAAEIANRWGGASWASGVGFRVSYLTLQADLQFDRNQISKAFTYWQGLGFLEPAGYWRTERGLVHKWNAVFPPALQENATSDLLSETAPLNNLLRGTAGVAVGDSTTLPSKEGSGASLRSAPDAYGEAEVAAGHRASAPPGSGSVAIDGKGITGTHSLGGVVDTAAPKPGNQSLGSPDIPSWVAGDELARGSSSLPPERPRRASWAERKRNDYLANADAIRSIAEVIPNSCLEGPHADGRQRSLHTVQCLYRLANRIARAYEEGDETETPAAIDRDSPRASLERAATLHEILGWQDEPALACA